MTSTTLLIGRMPAFTRRCAIHAGDGPIVTRGDPPEVARAARVVVDHHGDVAATTDASASAIGLRHVEVEREVRGELARHADDAHRVGPVGRDREVEDHVVETEDLAHVGAELGGGVEAEDPGVVVAEAELLGRAEHAVAHLRRGSCAARA